jgi:hypothetical protein
MGVSPWNIENTTRSPEGTKGTRAFASPFGPSGLPRFSCYRIHRLAPMATLFRPFGTRNALIDAHEWSRMVKDFGRTFKNVAGKPTVLLSNSGMDFDVFRRRLERKHPISKIPTNVRCPFAYSTTCKSPSRAVVECFVLPFLSYCLTRRSIHRGPVSSAINVIADPSLLNSAISGNSSVSANHEYSVVSVRVLAMFDSSLSRHVRKKILPSR